MNNYKQSTNCEICATWLHPQDIEHSQRSFNKIVCRLHSPYGTLPVSERYTDPIASQMALAEGKIIGEQLYANRPKVVVV